MDAMHLGRWCLVVGASILFWSTSARAAEETFYLGTFTHGTGGSQGIYIGTLDSETGKLGPLRLAAKEADPNFLALSPDHRFLVAALGKAVESFAVQKDETLRAINQQPSSGRDVCHVCLAPDGREVFIASYGSGSVEGFPVGADGVIGPRAALQVFTGSGPNPQRQKAPHAHSIYVDPEGKFVYACDLGTDNIWVFRREANGGLTPADPPFAKVPPGSGPRHLVINGARVYVVNEMGINTSVFARDAATGALTLVQTCNNIEGAKTKAGSTSAEIALHPSGEWLYVSTRSQEAISVFRVSPQSVTGQPVLTLVQNISSPALCPRSFGLDPTGRWMIVAGQNDNRIAVMKIDAASGQLAATSETASVGSPVCVLFVTPR
jgi:6-phosphogluconolactonase